MMEKQDIFNFKCQTCNQPVIMSLKGDPQQTLKDHLKICIRMIEYEILESLEGKRIFSGYDPLVMGYYIRLEKDVKLRSIETVDGKYKWLGFSGIGFKRR